MPMEQVREEDGEKEEFESAYASNIESKKASGRVIKSPPEGKSHLNGWWSRVKRGFASCVVTSAACFGSLICCPCRLCWSRKRGSSLQCPEEGVLEYPEEGTLGHRVEGTLGYIEGTLGYGVEELCSGSASWITHGDSPSANELFKVKTLPPLGGVKGNDGSGTAASGGRGNNG